MVSFDQSYNTHSSAYVHVCSASYVFAMPKAAVVIRFSELDSKPEGGVRLTLESWSQGLMMGALIIMAGITLANMRRGVLLHKLIFLEVRTHLISNIAHLHGYQLTFDAAPPGYAKRLLHLLQPTRMGLVSFIDSSPSDYIVVVAQYCSMDEEQTILAKAHPIDIHWHCDTGSSLLGAGDLR